VSWRDLIAIVRPVIIRYFARNGPPSRCVLTGINAGDARTIHSGVSVAKAANAIQASEKVDHRATAMPRSAIADAPTGLGIALTSDFDRASGLLALTSSSRRSRRSGIKQIERAYDG
jgi:hypothetical protein